MIYEGRANAGGRVGEGSICEGPAGAKGGTRNK